MKQKPVFAACVVGLSAMLGLSACGTSIEEKLDVAERVGEMGNASAVASPASSNVAGTVLRDGIFSKPISDMVSAGNMVAFRIDDVLYLGDLDALRNQSLQKVEFDPACGKLSADLTHVHTACGDNIMSITFGTAEVETTPSEQMSVDVVTRTSDGKFVAASTSENKVVVIEDGESSSPFKVEYPTDMIVAVPRPAQPDAVVRISRAYTLIQDVLVDKQKAGPMLRVGLGVGSISAGEQGMVLASDTSGNQLAVYGTEEVIRLHQTVPVAESPWAVAWDATHQQVLLASTADNTLSAYQISQGTPEESEQWNTVSDATNMVVLEDGTVLLASASGDGVQIITR